MMHAVPHGLWRASAARSHCRAVRMPLDGRCAAAIASFTTASSFLSSVPGIKGPLPLLRVPAPVTSSSSLHLEPRAATPPVVPRTSDALRLLLENAAKSTIAAGFIFPKGNLNAYQLAVELRKKADFASSHFSSTNIERWFSRVGLAPFVEFHGTFEGRHGGLQLSVKTLAGVERPVITPESRRAFLGLIQSGLAARPTKDGDADADSASASDVTVDGEWVETSHLGRLLMRSQDPSLRGVKSLFYWFEDEAIQRSVEEQELKGKRWFVRLTNYGKLFLRHTQGGAASPAEPDRGSFPSPSPSRASSNGSSSPARVVAASPSTNASSTQGEVDEVVSPAEYVKRLTATLDALPPYLKDPEGWVWSYSISTFRNHLQGKHSLSQCLGGDGVRAFFETKSGGATECMYLRRYVERQTPEHVKSLADEAQLREMLERAARQVASEGAMLPSGNLSAHAVASELFRRVPFPVPPQDSEKDRFKLQQWFADIGMAKMIEFPKQKAGSRGPTELRVKGMKSPLERPIVTAEGRRAFLSFFQDTFAQCPPQYLNNGGQWMESAHLKRRLLHADSPQLQIKNPFAWLEDEEVAKSIEQRPVGGRVYFRLTDFGRAIASHPAPPDAPTEYVVVSPEEFVEELGAALDRTPPVLRDSEGWVRLHSLSLTEVKGRVALPSGSTSIVKSVMHKAVLPFFELKIGGNGGVHAVRRCTKRKTLPPPAEGAGAGSSSSTRSGNPAHSSSRRSSMSLELKKALSDIGRAIGASAFEHGWAPSAVVIAYCSSARGFQKRAPGQSVNDWLAACGLADYVETRLDADGRVFLRMKEGAK